MQEVKGDLSTLVAKARRGLFMDYLFQERSLTSQTEDWGVDSLESGPNPIEIPLRRLLSSIQRVPLIPEASGNTGVWFYRLYNVRY